MRVFGSVVHTQHNDPHAIADGAPFLARALAQCCRPGDPASFATIVRDLLNAAVELGSSSKLKAKTFENIHKEALRKVVCLCLLSLLV